MKNSALGKVREVFDADGEFSKKKLKENFRKKSEMEASILKDKLQFMEHETAIIFHII